MEKNITIIIPAYHEEKLIKDIILRSKKFSKNIIVALAKRSKDNTEKIALSTGVKVIRDGGAGKGDGMKTAARHVKDGIIVFIDADGSHIPEDIPKIVKPIMEDRADMVIASRFLGGSEELHGDFNKFLRMFFSMCIAQFINWRFRTSIMDTQNGFRAIKTKTFKKLKIISKHTEIETEMVMKCFKKNKRILEVPSRELKRKYGVSNLSLRKHGLRHFYTVIRNLI
jgi:dolichol-phosphate hexosyltransferase